VEEREKIKIEMNGTSGYGGDNLICSLARFFWDEIQWR
jgi:hypothetical protein